MLDRFLPRHADNAYPGQKLALWLFSLLLLLKTIIGFNSIVNGGQVARGADGIPLDTFTPACARMVVTDFALLGLSQLVIVLLGVIVLRRYRALVPLMFAVLLLDHLGRRLILRAMPIVRTGSPPGVFVNLALLALTVVGLALSLRRPAGLPARR